ncbi:hypothetical protein Tco_0980630 [Tanacetum coccineum]
MHIENNVFENIFNTVMDTPKTKDSIKARMDIEKYCNRPDLHVWNQNSKVLKTKASYTLSKRQVKKVCEWLKNVKFPNKYASNIGGCVNLKDSSFYSFKSHECHVFMQRLLPIALKGDTKGHIPISRRLECTIGTTEDIQPISLVKEEIEEVQNALVTDVMNDDGEEYDFEDSDDDSSHDIDLYSSNHYFDDDG